MAIAYRTHEAIEDGKESGGWVTAFDAALACGSPPRAGCKTVAVRGTFAYPSVTDTKRRPHRIERVQLSISRQTGFRAHSIPVGATFESLYICAEKPIERLCRRALFRSLNSQEIVARYLLEALAFRFG